MSTAVQVSTTA